MLNYLTGVRKLSREVLHEYCVGAVRRQFADDAGQWTTHECIVMPWMTTSPAGAAGFDTSMLHGAGDVGAAGAGVIGACRFAGHVAFLA